MYEENLAFFFNLILLFIKAVETLLFSLGMTWCALGFLFFRVLDLFLPVTEKTIQEWYEMVFPSASAFHCVHGWERFVPILLSTLGDLCNAFLRSRFLFLLRVGNILYLFLLLYFLSSMIQVHSWYLDCLFS